MRDFDWIAKAFIASSGIVASIALDTLSVIASILAASMTIWYVWVQIRNSNSREKREVSEYNYNKSLRKKDKEDM